MHSSATIPPGVLYSIGADVRYLVRDWNGRVVAPLCAGLIGAFACCDGRNVSRQAVNAWLTLTAVQLRKSTLVQMHGIHRANRTADSETISLENALPGVIQSH